MPQVQLMLPLSFAADMNIEKYLNKPEIFQYKLIETSDIPFSQAVVVMCKANRCGKYGTCRTCPPGVGNLDKLTKKSGINYNNGSNTITYFCVILFG